MEKILIKGGRVFDGERFFFADVLTDGEKIKKIEADISLDADYIYDATGKTVSAGLVDTHVHIKRLSSDAFGINAEMSCLPFGVTAANDAGSAYGDRAFLDSIAVKNVVFVAQSLEGKELNFKFAEELLKKYGDKAIGLKVYFDKTISDI